MAGHPRDRKRRHLPACLLAAALGCNIPYHDAPPSKSAAPTPTPTAPAEPPTTQPPATRPTDPDPPSPSPVALGRPIDPAIIQAAEQARGTPDGAREAGERLRAGASGDALWGAVYVYAAGGDDPTLLEPLLAGDDPSIRVLAAGGLLRLGRKTAFPALVAETANTAMLAGSEPQQAIGEVAALMLSMATRQPIDISPGPATRQAWSDWYAANGDRLTFDVEKGWLLP